MYDNAYKTLDDLAERIRRGEIGSKTQESKPLALVSQRRNLHTNQEVSESESSSIELVLAHELAELRNNVEAFDSRQDSMTSEEAYKGSPSTHGNQVGYAREALAYVESAGSGDYDAVGPVVKKGFYKGDRAYGKYQVMGKNIPSWTKEILGKEMTVEEFRADHDAQDKVVMYRLQEAFNKHGTWEDAASVWFSGKPLKGNNKSDGFMRVPQYVSKFSRKMKELQEN